jgi:hypothetical protein
MLRSRRSYSASNMLLQCASSAAQYSLPAESSAWSFFTSNSRRRISLRSFCVSGCGAGTRTEARLAATGAVAGSIGRATGVGSACNGSGCGGTEVAASRVTRGAGDAATGAATGTTTGAAIGSATDAEGAKKSPRTSETPRDAEKGEGETWSSISGAAVDFGFIKCLTRVTRSCG